MENRTALSGIGGRKFAAFFAATLSLVALYLFGVELSEQTLDTIAMMYLAFAGGNGLEHIASRLGQRAGRPPVSDLPSDVIAAVRAALESGGTVTTADGSGRESSKFLSTINREQP